MRRLRLVPAAMVVIVLQAALGFGVVGCIKATPVDLANPTARPSAQLITTRERHDLAVISVDFEPRLGVQKAGQVNALLVVVDNKGTETEQGIVVEAILDGSRLGDTIVRITEGIPSLAPGEAKVVRFTRPAALAARTSYWLTARVGAVVGEAAVANNTKTLRIDVVGALSSD